MSATAIRGASPASTLRPVTADDRPSSRSIRTGRVLTVIVTLFLTFDSVIKLLQLSQAVDATVRLGYPASSVFGIGVIETICLAIYLIPRTAPIGAVLLTGFLGGAVATHFRHGDPLLTHVFFPLYVAALVWGGLYLRDTRARGLLRSR